MGRHGQFYGAHRLSAPQSWYARASKRFNRVEQPSRRRADWRADIYRCLGNACPGDPELAADFARRAGSVSHDGEAIYGAQVVAAIEAQAFVEFSLDNLLDTAVSFIPKDSVIYRLIADLRDWHQQDGDWRLTRERIVADYGYDKYGGNVHMVPNHALIVLALLYSEDDFQRSLTIVNTAGWDTDCNSGNVGCVMGIKNGLAGIDAGPDWRRPVADRLYISAATEDAPSRMRCARHIQSVRRHGRWRINRLNPQERGAIPL